jgi:hypothetical protein
LYKIIQSLDIPKTPWTSIVLDFVVKLLLLQDLIIGVKYNSILVVTDRLIKYTYMILYLEANTAKNLAYIFLRIIVANYSASEEMISDRNKFFILWFWKIIMVLLGIKRKLSISFYAQIDRQIERINQTIETYIRYYINYK